ncbi:MAG TPA: endonuclease/exonuclease/phosphatase family protein [Longimicrobiales bacterium]|nr:endonuclease/exonuclease/phosphatase family protein [Longimicrobiales bacterium]
MPEPLTTPEARHARLEPHRHDELHEELDAWRANVGSPVAIDAGPVAAERLTGIDVLCWNVAIGQGRLGAVLDRLRTHSAQAPGTSPDRPLIVLVQEAYREDATVPGAAESLHHGGRLASARRTNIVALAEESELSLRYSPSMRNGIHPSDRGNAVLSSVRLGESHAFLLPYVRQRRVAVSAQIAGHRNLTFVSAHLDTHGRTRRPTAALPARIRAGRIGRGRVAQARSLVRALEQIEGSVIIGADLNSLFGMSDPAVHQLVEAGFHPARRVGNWGHTFHRPLRLLLDHVLYRCTDKRIGSMSVVRIDEVEGDRSRTVYGSDHHPLLASIRFGES